MKPITIVGGGLAGLTLGLGLRQRGVPVTIWEAGDYPRHRVCGEFISGRGVECLRRRGLEEKLRQAGALTARTVAFGSPTSCSPPRTLPQPALCLSRHDLDAALADEFRRQGGTLRVRRRWNGAKFGPGMVRATGRRSRATVGGWRWLGLKVHARNVPLVADLEMHLVPDGYVGLCRLNGGVVNICGLFRRRARQREPSSPWWRSLSGAPGSPLSRRLERAWIDADSFCATAGLSLKPQRAGAHHECCVGDSITMIPPMTGNGMSMAFESAAAAVGAVTAFSRGSISWDEARETIARRCDTRFRSRLTWAAWLEWALVRPLLREPLVGLVSRNRWVRSLLFGRTR